MSNVQAGSKFTDKKVASSMRSQYGVYLSTAASKMLAKLQKADMVIRNGGRSMVWLLLAAITPLAVRPRASDVKVV